MQMSTAATAKQHAKGSATLPARSATAAPPGPAVTGSSGAVSEIAVLLRIRQLNTKLVRLCLRIGP